MDIKCPLCGEPYEYYFLAVELTEIPGVRAGLQAMGMDALDAYMKYGCGYVDWAFDGGLGSPKPCRNAADQPQDRLQVEKYQVLREILGDDVDGIVSELAD